MQTQKGRQKINPAAPGSAGVLSVLNFAYRFSDRGASFRRAESAFQIGSGNALEQADGVS